MRVRSILGLVALASASVLIAQERTSIESPLTRAAQARQNAVHSVDIRYVCKQTIPAGVREVRTKDFPKGHRVPEQSMQAESENRLLIDGKKTRLEFNVLMPDHETMKWQTSRIITTDDGTTYKYLIRRKEGELTKDPRDASAKIDHSQLFPTNSELGLVPVLMNLRGVSPRLDALWSLSNPAMWQREGAAVAVNGVSLQEYRHIPEGLPPHVSVRCWADTEPDSVIHRLEVKHPTDAHFLFEATYETHAPTGLRLPKTWKLTSSLTNNPLITVNEYTLKSMKVNEPVAATEFDVVFPANVDVVDLRAIRGTPAPDTMGIPNTAQPIENITGLSQQFLIGLCIVVGVIMGVLIFWLNRRGMKQNQSQTPA